MRNCAGRSRNSALRMSLTERKEFELGQFISTPVAHKRLTTYLDSSRKAGSN
jgi:hypothetical protein